MSIFSYVAPSSPPAPKAVETGLTFYETYFTKVKHNTAPLMISRGAYLNGVDNTRLAHLRQAAQSDVMILARGGFGLTKIQSSFHHVFSKNFPIIVGFSDVTTLLAYAFIHQQPAIHGPLLTTVAAEPTRSRNHLIDLLATEKALSLSGTHVLNPISKCISGRLFAGNLCVLTHLIGTNCFPSLRGSIVALEEVNEPLYKIDRMLAQHKNAGTFDGIKALCIGDFAGLASQAQMLEALFQSYFPRIPIATGFQFGHGTPNFALPVGQVVELQPDPVPQLLFKGLGLNCR